jgi:hypothetical protein
MVTQYVRHAWPAMTSWYSIICWAIREGLGKMNSLTPKPWQMISQMARVAISSSQGDQRSMVLGFMVVV